MVRSLFSLSTLKRLFLWSLLVVLITSAIGSILGWYYVERTRAQLPTIIDLTDLKPKYGTTIRAQDGTHLAGAPTSEPVAFDDLPPKLIAIFLAAEDEDFFVHSGYNPRSIARAFFVNYRAGETVQGASTITQQVAKHFLEPEQTWKRKFREFLLAREIEGEFSKEEILEAYLGGIYFGQNAYGITQASHTYFSVPPADLTTSQIAILAGLLPAPSVYNPVVSPEAALRERNRVLRRMRDTGILTQERFRELVDRPLEDPIPTSRPASLVPEAGGTVQRRWSDLGDGRDFEESELEIVTTHHPAYQHLARKSLQRGIEEQDRRRGFRGPEARAADSDAVDEALDALSPYTLPTLARVVALDDEVLTLRVPGETVEIDSEHVEWIGGEHPRTGRPRNRDVQLSDLLTVDDIVFARHDDDGWDLWQYPVHEGAFLLADHHSGEVLASVGAYDVDRSSFHRAEQACRQPGSLFKTILYAEAFANDVTPATLLSDVPTDVGTGDSVWQPRNADRDFRGYLTALDAYVASRNIPAANLYQHLGPRRIIDRARRFGIQSHLNPTPALALGASCTTVAEMLDTHAAVARGGLKMEHHHIAYIRDIRTGKIEDRGHFLQRDPSLLPRLARAADGRTLGDYALNPEVNALMVRALRDVVTRGTAHQIPNEWPVAAKTGTSDEFDTWLAAFDPHTTATIWVGSDRNTSPFLQGEHAGAVALPVFTHFYEGMAPDVDEWPPPPDSEFEIEFVRIDPTTGLRARDGESGIDYPFLRGTAPRDYSPTQATRQLEQIDSLTY